MIYRWHLTLNHVCCVLKSEDDAEESGTGSGSDDDDHSGSGVDFGRHQQPFYKPPEFDYGISFDFFSRPPVEVVTRRIHDDSRGRMTARYPVPTDTSARLEASLQLLLLLVIVTVFHCCRRYVVVADTRLSSSCFSNC